MTFYVKKAEDSNLEGPFTVDQINQMLKEKLLTYDSLAIAVNGRSPQELQSASKSDWQKVANLDGVVPDPEVEKGCFAIIILASIFVGIFALIALIKLKDILHRIH